MIRLSRRAWMWIFVAYAYLATVVCAAWFLRRMEREHGQTLAVGASLLWQGLIYGAWAPAVLAIWLVLRRWELRRPALIALPLLGLVLVPGHAVFAAFVDRAFSTGETGGFFGRVELRLPVDLLVYCALMAAGAAAYLQAHAAQLSQALASARHALARVDAPLTAEPTRLMVAAGRKRVPVDVGEIEWFGAAGNYVVVHWDGREGLIRETLQALAARLDTRVFARSHRSAIVNLGKVVAANALADGSWRLVTVSGGDLIVSRTYRDEILRRLGH